MIRYRVIAAVALMVLTMSACSGHEPRKAVTSTSTTGPAEVTTTTEAPEDTGTVPELLTTIEAQAEDIIDMVPEGRWSTVNADIAKTETTWASYRTHATHDGAGPELLNRLDAALAALHTAAGAHRAAVTMQAANDLSAVVVDLFGLYHSPVPLDVGRFDVIGRQIILDVDAKNLVAANTEIERIATVWNALKTDIVAHAGQRVATQTDELLAAMRAAVQHGDSASLRRKAADFLEAVDSMEQLYERRP